MIILNDIYIYICKVELMKQTEPATKRREAVDSIYMTWRFASYNMSRSINELRDRSMNFMTL